RHIVQELNAIPKTDTQHQHQQRSLPIELQELIIKFYNQDDISYKLAGKHDCITFKDNDGTSTTLQKRILLYRVRETFKLFLTDENFRLGNQDAVSLFTSHIWYSDGGQSCVCGSNNLTHNKCCISASLDNLFSQLKQQFQHLRETNVFF
ncbi:unnamed protein product, partial [Rotaria sp. Silwood1]